MVDLILKFPEGFTRDISLINLKGTLNDVLQTVIQRRFPLFDVEIDKIYKGEIEPPSLAERLYLLKDDEDEIERNSKD